MPRRYFETQWAALAETVREIDYNPDDPHAVRSVLDYPGLDGFKWKVWWVAASGFFTTAYSIFAVNVVGPAWHYVYPDCGQPANESLVITLTTLFGTAIGMILFGFLADHYGRKSLYGYELAIVIASTLGMTTVSEGKNSMNPYGWIGFWRFVLGIGLGAEYPLSATIAAEWSSTRSRGQTMAAVFLMQSVGQLAAYGLGWAMLAIVSTVRGLSRDEKNYDVAAPTIDIVWRVVIGIGVIPAVLSFVLRRLLPETPRWLAERGRIGDAAQVAAQVYAPVAHVRATEANPDAVSVQDGGSAIVATLDQNNGSATRWQRFKKYLVDVKAYLTEPGKNRQRALAGAMITWFLLDISFYGLGLDNPRTISAIWMSDAPKTIRNLACNETWKTDPANLDISIYAQLEEDSIRNMINISTGTLTGSLIILFAIDYVPRVTWMTWIFVALGGLFAISGGTFFIAYETEKHAVTITLYVLAQTLFNLGPNTMTFILPAELFGTRYRATFHGLAAAAGKAGAIISTSVINVVVQDAIVKGGGRNEFAGLMLFFCPVMLLGALVSWVWIPEVQYPRSNHEAVPIDEEDGDGEEADEEANERARSFRKRMIFPNKPLEEIAMNPSEGQYIGMRKNLVRLLWPITSFLCGYRSKREAKERRSGEEIGAQNASEMVQVHPGGHGHSSDVVD